MSLLWQSVISTFSMCGYACWIVDSYHSALCYVLRVSFYPLYFSPLWMDCTFVCHRVKKYGFILANNCCRLKTNERTTGTEEKRRRKREKVEGQLLQQQQKTLNKNWAILQRIWIGHRLWLITYKFIVLSSIETSKYPLSFEFY